MAGNGDPLSNDSETIENSGVKRSYNQAFLPDNYTPWGSYTNIPPLKKQKTVVPASSGTRVTNEVVTSPQGDDELPKPMAISNSNIKKEVTIPSPKSPGGTVTIRSNSPGVTKKALQQLVKEITYSPPKFSLASTEHKKKYVSPIPDPIFKILMSNPENALNIINIILGTEFVKIDIMNNELFIPQAGNNGKDTMSNEIDFLCKVYDANDKEQVIGIEMQSKKTEYFLARLITYLNEIFVSLSKVQKGDSKSYHEKIVPVSIIVITCQNVLDKIFPWNSEFSLTEKNTGQKFPINTNNFHFLELAKFKNILKGKKITENIEYLADFFLNCHKKKSIDKNIIPEAIQKLYKAMEIDSFSPSERKKLQKIFQNKRELAELAKQQSIEAREHNAAVKSEIDGLKKMVAQNFSKDIIYHICGETIKDHFNSLLAIIAKNLNAKPKEIAKKANLWKDDGLLSDEESDDSTFGYTEQFIANDTSQVEEDLSNIMGEDLWSYS